MVHAVGHLARVRHANMRGDEPAIPAVGDEVAVAHLGASHMPGLRIVAARYVKWRASQQRAAPIGTRHHCRGGVIGGPNPH